MLATGLLLTNYPSSNEANKNKEVPKQASPSENNPPPGTENELILPDLRGEWNSQEIFKDSITLYKFTIEGETQDKGTYTITVSEKGFGENPIPQTPNTTVSGKWSLTKTAPPKINLVPDHDKNLTVIRELSGWKKEEGKLPTAMITSAKGKEILIWKKPKN